MTHGWKNGFAPIKDFSGTYDGNGYKISNLEVNAADEAFKNIGLFGELQGGLLKRVKLVDFSTKGGVNVGSLVGLNNQGTIEDSEVDGKVDGDGTIGGLVGLNQDGVIRNSFTLVRVGKNSRDTWVAGGLVGQNDGGMIAGSFVMGAVTGGNQVGGLVGKNRGSVISSGVTGDVTGTDTSVGYVGGLVGWHLGGTISDSHSGGKVVGAALGIGGLVGVSEGNARIVNSRTSKYARVAGKNQVGGLVGENKGRISNSYAKGTVTGNSQTGGLVGQNGGGTIEGSRALGAVTGANQVGGLVGENKGSISNSYTQGAVTGDSQTGGLVGRHLGGTISDSYALNQVVGTASGIGGLVGVSESNARIVNSHTRLEVRVSGKDQVGGLVGENKGNISNSYARGSVTGGSQTGGLVGLHLGGTISGSYALNQVVGTASGVGGLVGVSESNARIVSSHVYLGSRVSGKNQVGGLVGDNKGSISNSYARGAVSGDSQTGGLAGVNSGTVISTYSTGAVGGTDLPGRLVGVNSGTIAHSYASKLGDVDSLVGENDGTVQGSALRTVEQMKCSMDPVNLCRVARVYLDWDTRIWHFGHSRVLPVLRVLTDVPAAPLAVRVNWNSRGGLTLHWGWHQGVAVSSFEVDVDGIIRNTEGTRFTLGGSLMA